MAPPGNTLAVPHSPGMATALDISQWVENAAIGERGVPEPSAHGARSLARCLCPCRQQVTGNSWLQPHLLRVCSLPLPATPLLHLNQKTTLALSTAEPGKGSQQTKTRTNWNQLRERARRRHAPLLPWPFPRFGDTVTWRGARGWYRGLVCRAGICFWNQRCAALALAG